MEFTHVLEDCTILACSLRDAQATQARNFSMKGFDVDAGMLAIAFFVCGGGLCRYAIDLFKVEGARQPGTCGLMRNHRAGGTYIGNNMPVPLRM